MWEKADCPVVGREHQVITEGSCLVEEANLKSLTCLARTCVIWHVGSLLM